ncbi:MAG: hypothetical protein ACLQGP_28600 [Isosphaeraceae bacterium]
MTTFDLAEVQGFTADIHARMNRPNNGEGSECTALDADLRRYTELCREFCNQVRQWGLAVFCGRVELDPEVEEVLKVDGRRLYSRATEVLRFSQGAETSCYRLDEQAHLEDALRDLDQLVNRWITPKLSVGPSARLWMIPGIAATEDEIEQVASLPPLPIDWQSAEPRQQERPRKLRTP